LSDFSINVRSQRIFLTAWCPLAGYATWVTIRAEFESVVYIAIVSDNPIVLSNENGLDRFEELSQSALRTFVEDDEGVREALASNDELLVVRERGGFQSIVTDFGTQTVARSHRHMSLRYFVISSSWLSAKWLCSAATFELVPDPA
jgi:hypothetical protein